MDLTVSVSFRVCLLWVLSCIYEILKHIIDIKIWSLPYNRFNNTVVDHSMFIIKKNSGFRLNLLTQETRNISSIGSYINKCTFIVDARCMCIHTQTQYIDKKQYSMAKKLWLEGTSCDPTLQSVTCILDYKHHQLIESNYQFLEYPTGPTQRRLAWQLKNKVNYIR